jgi:hypothetical protein
MERESTGTKYMVANCEGSQSPPRAVELRKKKTIKMLWVTTSYNLYHIFVSYPHENNFLRMVYPHFGEFHLMEPCSLAYLGSVS